MTVIVLIAAPRGLRGHVTRWLLEVAAGIFVGTVSKRVRDYIWEITRARIGDGQAVMIEPAATEQDCAFRTAGRERWKPTDFDGLTLLARPRDPHEP
ncbi:type I-E CRISPR-associated endoribonuclease Cas2e [Haloglycomyces albus]|uniref:type I-E CRISPR-associated endoribonuclease Cas2e n=1 Tax=Haloglycomyces albus TaxID=526067 RepID=UPI000A029A2E